MIVRTDFQLSFTPTDLFEAPTLVTFAGGQAHFADGRVIYELAQPAHPVTDSLRKTITDQVRGVLQARSLLARRPFTLEHFSATHYEEGGKRNMVLFLESAVMAIAGGTVDIVVRDAQGNIKIDTKAERIASEAHFVSNIAVKAGQSPTLQRMLDSLARSVSDSDNELVHLYEVRDAAAKHFGDERTAQAKLHIARSDWKALGKLANSEPIAQGRHRGRHLGGTRPATKTELQKARDVAMLIMNAMASMV